MAASCWASYLVYDVGKLMSMTNRKEIMTALDIFSKDKDVCVVASFPGSLLENRDQ